MTQTLILQKRPQIDPERCLLVVDGVTCQRRAGVRGLCSAHAQLLRHLDRIDEFALPRRKVDRRYRFEVKVPAEQDAGRCRIRANDVPCQRPASRRGMCASHYQSIWQRPDLRLDDFCAPPEEKDMMRRKRLIAGECRVREGGVDCTKPPHARGLCHHHYGWLRKHAMPLFIAIAELDPNQRTLELRRRFTPGRCRVAENNSGCGSLATVRGLCQHHYSVLRGQPELLEVVAEKPRTATAFTVITPTPHLSCHIAEDGKACTGPAVHRGLCRHHRRVLGSNGHKRSDFMLPQQEVELRAKTSLEAIDGLCRAVLGSQPCRVVPLRRGLCRNHLRLAERRGCLDRIALTTSALPSTHVYLDKNVLFDYLDYLEFGRSGQMPSVNLVAHINAGRLRASIGLDSLKTAYSRVRYRRMRDVEPVGQVSDEVAAAADQVARGYIDRLLGSGGGWQVVAIDAITFAETVRRGIGNLSLEDALEWSTYQLARSRPGGPQCFVTRDGDFPEGVRPNNVLLALSEDASQRSVSL